MGFISIWIGAAGLLLLQGQDSAVKESIAVTLKADFTGIRALDYAGAPGEILSCIGPRVEVTTRLQKAVRTPLYSHESDIVAIATNRLKTLCATSDALGRIIVWDLKDARIKVDKCVGRQLVLAAVLKAVKPGSVEESLARAECELEVAKERVSGIEFHSNDHDLIIFGGLRENVIRIWSGPDWSMEEKIEGHLREVTFVKILGLGQLLLSGSRDSSLRWVELPSKRVLRTLGEPDGSFAIDGRYPAACSMGSGRIAVAWKAMRADRIDIYDLSTWEVTSTVHVSNFGICALGMLGDDHMVFSGTDCSIRVWSISRGIEVAACSPGDSNIVSLCISPDKKSFLGRTASDSAYEFSFHTK